MVQARARDGRERVDLAGQWPRSGDEIESGEGHVTSCWDGERQIGKGVDMM